MDGNNFGNVPARVYSSDSHVLLFLHGRGDEEAQQPAAAGWLEVSNPDMVAAVKEVQYTTDSLAKHLNAEAIRQLGEEQALLSVSFRSPPQTRWL